MDFQVRCECGGYVVVCEGAAGARMECPCGRTVAVPSLAELREQAGLAAHRGSARFIIENMLAHGELPTMTACARCNGATDDTVAVTAECEKAWGSEPGWITWLFVLLLGGIWALLLLFQ